MTFGELCLDDLFNVDHPEYSGIASKTYDLIHTKEYGYDIQWLAQEWGEDFFFELPEDYEVELIDYRTKGPNNKQTRR